MSRDHIPAQIERLVLVEAGHRCAIPTCRQPTTEIAHIVPWAKSQDNSFENLIALCPNCHTRYDQKKEIDQLSIKMYKANLAILNNRYNDFERRVFELFAGTTERRIMIPGGNELHLAMAVKDGILYQMPGADKAGSFTMSFSDGVQISTPLYQVYILTDFGANFVQKYKSGESLS